MGHRRENPVSLLWQPKQKQKVADFARHDSLRWPGSLTVTA